MSISGLTLRNGFLGNGFNGGAVIARTSLTLDSVTIRDNVAQWGGGVMFFTQYAGQTLTITNSQFINNIAKPNLANNGLGFYRGGGALSATDNCGARTPTSMTITGSFFSGNRVISEPNSNITADGGAIALDFAGPVLIEDTRMVDNHADSNPLNLDIGLNGGAITAYAASLTIRRSGIVLNSADFVGGVLAINADSSLQAAGSAMQFLVENSTISGNVANQIFGGLAVGGNVTAIVRNSTVGANVANALNEGPPVSGIGVGKTDPSQRAPTLQLVSSIVADGQSSAADIFAFDVPVPFSVTASNSLVQLLDPNVFLAGSGNQVGVDPLLGPPAFNGGPTRTQALLAGSPAINAGSNPSGLTTDQRGAGFPRTTGLATDIGAYEAQPGVPTSITISSGSGQGTRVGTAFAQPLVVLVKDSFGAPVPGATVTWTAPSSGASATFNSSPSTLTNASGFATIGVTASSVFGGYAVAAQVAAFSASFNLTNAIAVAAGTSCGGNAATNADLVEHYYASILNRASDAGGKAFWTSESDRLCALGADVQQTFVVMANAFFNTPEYLGRNRTDTQFVTDLYGTFFGRQPDAGGNSFWLGQLAQGNPRNNVMSSFLLAPEFEQTMSSVFQNPPARAETYLVLNLYGGLLRRLAETGGYQFWTAQFRAAQCDANPVQAVTTTVDAVSSGFAASGEYAARNTTNGQVVEDLYYALLQRGAELAGYGFWKGQLDGAVLTRTQVRQQFLTTPEMQTVSAAIAAQGCLP